MNPKWHNLYLDIADRLAQESHAVRLKVGAVFVSPDGIMSTGINGLPAGASNVCEESVIIGITETIDMHGNKSSQHEYGLKTLPHVNHAEENLFGKIMQQGISAKGGRIYITHAPCMQCAKIIVVAGISEVHYRREYRTIGNGVSWLLQNNIKVLRG